MTAQEKITFCRLCEQMCGLRVTVDNGVVTRIRADREHPLTRGFACPKGLAANEIQYDPARVTTPLRRTASGGFEPVTWSAALHEIGTRLRGVIDRYGPESIGMYQGNPAAYSIGHYFFAKGMMDALGSPHFYSPASQDTSSRFAASYFLYGSPVSVPIPDLPRTDFLLMVGANPFVSHGSLMQGGLVRVDMQEIVERGGRVVIVDPRRTETAERFEHVAVLPDGDAWLLLALLNVIFADGLQHPRAAAIATGLPQLRQAVQSFTPAATEKHSGVPAAVARDLARSLAAAPRAAVYGRVGACVGSYGTLVNFLLDALNVVTGNLDRPGGAVFTTPPIDFWGIARNGGFDTYGARHTRIGGYPDVVGMMPAGILADEITTPGPGQIRAMFVSAGNPVLSVPNGPALKAALETVDLMVSIDLYINETNSTADYILPSTTFLEREDVNGLVLPYQYRTFVQWTPAVVPPLGQAREEWTIIRDISAQLGLVASSSPLIRRLGRFARRLTPALMLDMMLRFGSAGDRLGLRRGGLSRRRLLSRPRGVLVAEEVKTGVLERVITRPDGRVNLAPPEIIAVAQGLFDEVRDAAVGPYPLRLFGRRELRSLNSFTHNSRRLNPRAVAPALLMHPDDVQRFGLQDGATVLIESATGAVRAQLSSTDTVIVGAVCLPHGWGHNGDGNWQHANATGGANFNALTASGAGALEPLAAMSILNGVRVKVSALD